MRPVATHSLIANMQVYISINIISASREELGEAKKESYLGSYPSGLVERNPYALRSLEQKEQLK